MLTRRWEKTNTTYTWKPCVEEHMYIDGSLHYSFRDRFGRPSDLTGYEEAKEIIRCWRMDEVKL